MRRITVRVAVSAYILAHHLHIPSILTESHLTTELSYWLSRNAFLSLSHSCFFLPTFPLVPAQVFSFLSPGIFFVFSLFGCNVSHCAPFFKCSYGCKISPHSRELNMSHYYTILYYILYINFSFFFFFSLYVLNKKDLCLFFRNHSQIAIRSTGAYPVRTTLILYPYGRTSSPTGSI